MANEIYREIFVTREEYTPPIQYVQGANAIPIVVRVCDYNIPSGSKANVFVKKPSGKSVQDTAVIDGNTVTIDVTTQMFAEVGTSIIQIQITNGQDVLITFDLPAMVRKNRTEPGAPESENEAAFFTELQEAANKARIAAQEANNAAQAAEDALSVLEGAVEGTIINDDTPSDVTTFSGRHIENTFLKKNGDGGNVIVTFQKAADRAGIESGDSLAVAFGKLAKFFTDIQSYVFSPPVNNLLSTDTSRPLSAEMGKQLQEKIDQLNSALAKKEYELTSYNSDAITLINTICRKSGNVVSISGYFQSSKVISANVNFMHIDPSICPTERTYFIISSNIEEAPNYAKMDSSGYVQFDVDAPAGYYFFNFGYIV